MASVTPPRRQGEPVRLVLRELRGLLTHPAFILYAAFACTSNYWPGAVVYLTLRTYLIAPSGWIAWTVAIALPLALIAGISIIGWSLARDSTAVRAATNKKKLGDIEGYRRDIAPLTLRRRNTVWRVIWLLMLPALFVAPVCAAVFIAETGSPGLVKVHGKLRWTTKVEEIQRYLRVMERRGIFTPLH